MAQPPNEKTPARGRLNPAFKAQVKAGRTRFGTPGSAPRSQTSTGTRDQPARAPMREDTEVDQLRKGNDFRGVPMKRLAVETKDLVTPSTWKLGTGKTIPQGRQPNDPMTDDPAGKAQRDAGRRRPDRQNTQDFPDSAETKAAKAGNVQERKRLLTPDPKVLSREQKSSARKSALSKNTVTFTRRK